MKIYLGHSSKQNYKEELYEPIQNSLLYANNEFFFPHLDSNIKIPTKDIIKQSDLFIAEVSYPSTGLGIELGFAVDANVDVLCIYKEGKKPSSSLNFITKNIKTYKDEKELIKIIEEFINMERKNQ